MSAVRFSILIVNFKTPDWTRNCIESIRRCSEPQDYELIVIDNHSQDASLAYLCAQPDLSLIERTDGLVYGAPDHGTALDIGARQARGKYIIALDSDVLILKAGWLDTLNQILENEHAALVGPAFYRNFIHACFLVIEREVLFRHKLSFAPCNRWHKYYDTAEYITHVLLKQGYRIVKLDGWTGDYVQGTLEKIDGTDLALWVQRWWALVAGHGAFIGNLAFHAFYGTRVSHDKRDQFDRVLQERNFQPAQIQQASRVLSLSYTRLTDARSRRAQFQDNLRFGYQAGHWLIRHTAVRVRDAVLRRGQRQRG